MFTWKLQTNLLSYASLFFVHEYIPFTISSNRSPHVAAEFTPLKIKITPTSFLKDDYGLAMFIHVQEYF